MKRLYLLRHAKSKSGELPDLDRPLSKSGRRDISALGAWISRQAEIPDKILCSPALRTLDTCDGLRKHLKNAPEPRVLKSLYNAPPSILLTRIRAVADAANSLMVVAHNPGLQLLASQLAGEGSKRRCVEKIGKKFPNGAMAIFETDIKTWRELDSSNTRLIRLVRPKDLR